MIIARCFRLLRIIESRARSVDVGFRVVRGKGRRGWRDEEEAVRMSAPPPDIDGSSWNSAYHAPVLAREVIDILGGSEIVLDGTLGGGGHSQALLDAGVKQVIGIDRDPDALDAVRARLASYAS